MSRVEVSLASGPIKVQEKEKVDRQHFPVDENGEIIGFDLDKFKEAMKYPQNKNWEYT